MLTLTFTCDGCGHSFPQENLEPEPATLQVLCVGCFQELMEYPEEVIAMIEEQW
jgi:hypothetical protein